MPMGKLMDLIACYQIVNGAEERSQADDDDMLPDIL